MTQIEPVSDDDQHHREHQASMFQPPSDFEFMCRK
jgi:hypothetical protein